MIQMYIVMNRFIIVYLKHVKNAFYFSKWYRNGKTSNAYIGLKVASAIFNLTTPGYSTTAEKKKTLVEGEKQSGSSSV